jgi:hypothetical protein
MAIMLDGLLARISAETRLPVFTVPPVLSPKEQREPLHATNYVPVPWVRSVPSEKNPSEIIASIKQEQSAQDTCGPFDDRHYCHECANLIRQRCIVQKYRPLDDLPRRCSDYKSP